MHPESILLARKPSAVYDRAMIDAAQIRAARGLLNWTQGDLAGRAGLSLGSIKKVETDKTDPRASTLRAIQSAFEAAGIVFVTDGVTRPAGKGAKDPSPPSSPR